MQVFDKILTELSNNDLILNGELIQPNHFRISVNLTNLLFSCEILRQYKFKLQSIGSPQLEKSTNLEYFFSLFTNDRDFLFSIYISIEAGKQNIPSLGDWEEIALIYEEAIMAQSNIRFTRNNQSESLLLFR